MDHVLRTAGAKSVVTNKPGMWYTSVIQATWEAGSRRITVQDQPWEKSMRPYLKNN
jgi:hypothetical protein